MSKRSVLARLATKICDKCSAPIPDAFVIERRYMGPENFAGIEAWARTSRGEAEPEPFPCHLIHNYAAWGGTWDLIVCGPVREMNETESWIHRLEAESA